MSGHTGIRTDNFVQSPSNGNNTLAALVNSKRQLVFVDDGGTPGKQLPALAADFALMCGVVVASEAYDAVKTGLWAIRRTLPRDIKEFHATEIVNPSRQSPWKQVSVEVRLSSLKLLADLFAESVDRVLYCYVSGEQYTAELQPKILALGGPDVSHKKALNKVFFNGLVGYLQRTGLDTAIVADSPKKLGDAIEIRAMAQPNGFYEGGVIYADSCVEEGLQLADLAAYVINRAHFIKHRRAHGNSNSFDDLILELLARMHPKLMDLLLINVDSWT